MNVCALSTLLYTYGEVCGDGVMHGTRRLVVQHLFSVFPSFFHDLFLFCIASIPRRILLMRVILCLYLRGFCTVPYHTICPGVWRWIFCLFALFFVLFLSVALLDIVRLGGVWSFLVLASWCIGCLLLRVIFVELGSTLDGRCEWFSTRLDGDM
jgi:hypothetical protein